MKKKRTEQPSEAKSRKRIDCLGLGIMPIDLLFTIPFFPKAGGKVDATRMTMQGGGPIPNVMVGMARLGFKTGIITGVGNDLFASHMIGELKQEGVDTKLIISRTGRSESALGFVEQGSGRRTIALCRSIYLRPTDLNTETYPTPRLIHLDGRDLEACTKLARWGRRVGAIVCFDIGSIRNDVSSIFPLVDHLIVADSYAFPFTKKKSAKAAIEVLRKYCRGAIVVTEGIKGATGLENGMYSQSKAFKVRAVDTTGAGDAFHTGYFYGLLNGYDLSTRMHLGAAVAAIKVQKPGARGGLPTLNELKRFLRKRHLMYA